MSEIRLGVRGEQRARPPVAPLDGGGAPIEAKRAEADGRRREHRHLDAGTAKRLDAAAVALAALLGRRVGQKLGEGRQEAADATEPEPSGPAPPRPRRGTAYSRRRPGARGSKAGRQRRPPRA